jgi:hypothetical protein
MAVREDLEQIRKDLDVIDSLPETDRLAIVHKMAEYRTVLFSLFKNSNTNIHALNESFTRDQLADVNNSLRCSTHYLFAAFKLICEAILAKHPEKENYAKQPENDKNAPLTV